MKFLTNIKSTCFIYRISLPLLSKFSYKTFNINLVYGIVLLALACAYSPAYANNSLESDHPLMSRFEGAERFNQYSYDYIAADLPISAVDDITANQNKLSVMGKGSFIRYYLPISTSTFEVIKSFKSQFKASMFETVFECEKNDNINTCGKDIYEFSIKNKLEFGFQNSCTTESEFYLSTSKIARKDGKNTYVFVCVFDDKVNQTIIEEKDFNPNKIKILSSYQPTEKSLSGLKEQTQKDIDGAKDHPLITRFPNTYISEYKKIDFAEAKFPIKNFTYHEQDNLSDDYFVKTSGAISFTGYKGQDGLSVYQVYQNYLEGFKASKMDIIFTCNGEDECDYGMQKLGSISDIAPAMRGTIDRCVGYNVSVIAAKKVISPQQNIYVYLCINTIENVTISQTIIEEKPLKTGLISLSANKMASALSTQGKVAIYGIHFATNSDKVMESSTPAFKQVSALLTQNKKLTLYVVGHTDSQGDEVYNKTLAEKRAKAVVNILVQTYGVAQKRLQARVVGELVPISTNQASEGRQLNRRVELVQL